MEHCDKATKDRGEYDWWYFPWVKLSRNVEPVDLEDKLYHVRQRHPEISLIFYLGHTDENIRNGPDILFFQIPSRYMILEKL